MRKVVYIVAVVLLLGLGTAYAQEEGAAGGEEASVAQSNAGLYAIAAALAVGLAAAGAGFGIGHTGSAALGAIAEKPETSTWALIFVALAEGIALYGLIIAFMLITRI